VLAAMLEENAGYDQPLDDGRSAQNRRVSLEVAE
jgi:hypothetical protein